MTTDVVAVNNNLNNEQWSTSLSIDLYITCIGHTYMYRSIIDRQQKSCRYYLHLLLPFYFLLFSLKLLSKYYKGKNVRKSKALRHWGVGGRRIVFLANVFRCFFSISTRGLIRSGTRRLCSRAILRSSQALGPVGAVAFVRLKCALSIRAKHINITSCHDLDVMFPIQYSGFRLLRSHVLKIAGTTLLRCPTFG